jgi:hypothetical protein
MREEVSRYPLPESPGLYNPEFKETAMTPNFESNEMMTLTKLVDARSESGHAHFNKRRPALKNILVLLGVATLVAACSAADSSDLASPPLAEPTHLSVVVPIADEGHFHVTVWRIPLLLSADFVPG